MDTDTAAFAAEIAPHLDRLRLGVMRAAVELGMRTGLLQDSGLDAEAFTVFAMLRNAFPDRGVPVRNFRAAYVYRQPALFDAALAQAVRAGLVRVGSDQVVTLTEGGRALMTRIRASGADAAEGRWGSGPLDELEPADRCLRSAAETAEPDGAFHLVAPPYDEAADSDATRLAERLTGLRWHRFDAHVAAWSSRGHTASSVSALGEGPERDAIEASTNERAGAAYVALTAVERQNLLRGLQRLS